MAKPEGQLFGRPVDSEAQQDIHQRLQGLSFVQGFQVILCCFLLSNTQEKTQ